MASHLRGKPGPPQRAIVFINSDKENRDPLKHRSAINTHVSVLGHEKRRQLNAQRLQERSKHARLPVVVPAGWSIPATTNKKYEACPDCGSASTPHDCRSDRPTLPPLSSILKEGNSDPFGTSVIVVDSTISRLLDFNKKCILPSIHGREIADGKTASYANSYWQDSIASLQDECQGYGYLARFAAILAAVTSDRKMVATAMVFKHRASELLRQKLAEQSNSMQVHSNSLNASRTNLCWSIYALLTADVAAHNFDAAIVHARILQRFLQPGDTTPTVTDPRLLHAALYNDTQRSSVSLTRPVFDLDRLAAGQTQTAAMFVVLSSNGKYTHQKYSKALDCTVGGTNLRTTFLQIRHLLEIAWMMAGNPDLASDSLIIYLSTWVLICEGRLINIILNMEEQASRRALGTVHIPDEVFAAFAALYWLRRVSRHEGCGVQLSMVGLKAFNSGPIILSRLEGYLLGVDHGANSSNIFRRDSRESTCSLVREPNRSYAAAILQPAQSARLKLWVSYIAAIAERASLGPGIRFQQSFLAHARIMGYFSWRQVCDSVLKAFLQDDSVDPDTSAWFEKNIHLTDNILHPIPG